MVNMNGRRRRRARASIDSVVNFDPIVPLIEADSDIVMSETEATHRHYRQMLVELITYLTNILHDIDEILDNYVIYMFGQCFTNYFLGKRK